MNKEMKTRINKITLYKNCQINEYDVVLEHEQLLNELEHKVYEKYQYVRKQDESLVLKIQEPYDELELYNYVKIENNENTIILYGFVTDKEFINPNNTYIHVDVDILNTYLPYVSLHNYILEGTTVFRPTSYEYKKPSTPNRRVIETILNCNIDDLNSVSTEGTVIIKANTNIIQLFDKAFPFEWDDPGYEEFIAYTNNKDVLINSGSAIVSERKVVLTSGYVFAIDPLIENAMSGFINSIASLGNLDNIVTAEYIPFHRRMNFITTKSVSSDSHGNPINRVISSTTIIYSTQLKLNDTEYRGLLRNYKIEDNLGNNIEIPSYYLYKGITLKIIINMMIAEINIIIEDLNIYETWKYSSPININATSWENSIMWNIPKALTQSAVSVATMGGMGAGIAGAAGQVIGGAIANYSSSNYAVNSVNRGAQGFSLLDNGFFLNLIEYWSSGDEEYRYVLRNMTEMNPVDGEVFENIDASNKNLFQYIYDNYAPDAFNGEIDTMRCSCKAKFSHIEVQGVSMNIARKIKSICESYIQIYRKYY